MIVRVKITAVIPVEIDDDVTDPKFLIEENGCPGTGAVGAALEALIAKSHAENICWACANEGKNEIVG